MVPPSLSLPLFSCRLSLPSENQIPSNITNGQWGPSTSNLFKSNKKKP
jgi:hypothetical protein